MREVRKRRRSAAVDADCDWLPRCPLFRSLSEPRTAPLGGVFFAVPLEALVTGCVRALESGSPSSAATDVVRLVGSANSAARALRFRASGVEGGVRLKGSKPDDFACCLLLAWPMSLTASRERAPCATVTSGKSSESEALSNTSAGVVLLNLPRGPASAAAPLSWPTALQNCAAFCCARFCTIDRISSFFSFSCCRLKRRRVTRIAPSGVFPESSPDSACKWFIPIPFA
mmetsp:Transcript_69368/g.166321  ORF Transcript_69368/g.166321 Transcript_69368/m.166321 type:complete len:229 (-) Transcript_69368:70-756(-)